MEQKKTMEISIGGVSPSEQTVERFSCCIWAPAGLGKTTLAMTAPRRKALINFDPDGPASIPKSVIDATASPIYDLSAEDDAFYARSKDSDPLGTETTVVHFDTNIIDSITSITEPTLGRGMDVTQGATVERPSPGAY